MRRMKNDKGFTLAELLIVVAIIAVLVAVSIPIFTNQLEKSREATDVANFRAAKAAVIVAILDGTISADDENNTTYYYHADTGILDKTPVTVPYGEGTDKNPFGSKAIGDVYPSPYDPTKGYTSSYIFATVRKSSLSGKASIDVGWYGLTDVVDNYDLSTMTYKYDGSGTGGSGSGSGG